MIANINAIKTSTTLPEGVLQREYRRLRRCLCGCCSVRGQAQRRRHSRDAMAGVLSMWVDVVADRRSNAVTSPPRATADGRSSTTSKRHPSATTRLSKRKTLRHAALSPAPESGSPNTIFFMHCHSITLPHTMTSLRLQGEEARALTDHVNATLTPWARAGLQRFRDRARARHRQKADMRRVEFDTWCVVACGAHCVGDGGLCRHGCSSLLFMVVHGRVVVVVVVVVVMWSCGRGYVNDRLNGETSAVVVRVGGCRYIESHSRRRVLAGLSYATLSILVLLTFTCCVRCPLFPTCAVHPPASSVVRLFVLRARRERTSYVCP